MKDVPRHEQMQASRLDRIDGGQRTWFPEEQKFTGMNPCAIGLTCLLTGSAMLCSGSGAPANLELTRHCQHRVRRYIHSS